MKLKHTTVLVFFVLLATGCTPAPSTDEGRPSRGGQGKADGPACTTGESVDIPVYKGDPRLASDQAAICLDRDAWLVVVLCGDRQVTLAAPEQGFLGDRYSAIAEGELHWIEIWPAEDESGSFALDWVLPACRGQIEKPDHSGEPFTCPEGHFAADVREYRQAMQSFLGGHYDTVEVCVPGGQALFKLTQYSTGWFYDFEQGSVKEVLVSCNGVQKTLSYAGKTNSSYTGMSNFETGGDSDSRSAISIRFEPPEVDDPTSAPEVASAVGAEATTNSWGQIRYCDD
jgi:hypothetical protein